MAEELKREFPHLRRFATLSPIPGFRRWLDRRRARRSRTSCCIERLADPAWHLGEVPDALQKLLMRLCALLPLEREARRVEPLDPVARFHLGNGAALERLNWMGDTSETGMARSAGMMVNYVYWLDEVEQQPRALLPRARHRRLARGGEAGARMPARPERLSEGRLAENVMHFARLLRAAGLRIGPDRVIDCVQALEIAGGIRAARGLVLDHVGGAALAPGAAADLRPGVPASSGATRSSPSA